MGQSAAEFLPRARTLPGLRRAAARCRGCELWRDATQTVFGKGPRSAELMLVGEQPGDREDREGEPFVGPAGALLDRALAEAGIARETVSPQALVALGATAARSLFGPAVSVTRDRGRLLETPLAPIAAATVHPSAILRAREAEERRDAFAGLVEDLGTVSAALQRLAPSR